MRGIIVSNYALIREGLTSILSRHNNMEIDLVSETLKDAIKSIKEGGIQIVFLDLHENNKDELLLIKEMNQSGVRSKFVIFDFNNRKELFMEAIKCGVDGYILGQSSETEILHVIDQISRGKKYYDSGFIDSMLNKNYEEPEDDAINELTAREREVLSEIGMGMSNGKISEKFFISQNTVKKHINHIFDKLNIRDRTQAALYENKCRERSLSRSIC